MSSLEYGHRELLLTPLADAAREAAEEAVLTLSPLAVTAKRNIICN